MRVEAPRRAVTLDEVRAHRDAIKRLGERFGVRNIRVFGSVARSEATPDSDLDLLVDVERGHGYFDMAGFALGVEDELGVMTQVATPGGLKLRIRDRVLREAVAGLSDGFIAQHPEVPWRQIIATAIASCTVASRSISTSCGTWRSSTCLSWPARFLRSNPGALSARAGAAG